MTVHAYAVRGLDALCSTRSVNINPFVVLPQGAMALDTVVIGATTQP